MQTSHDVFDAEFSVRTGITLGGPLGVGAFSVVREGRMGERDVAVKLATSGSDSDQATIVRFRREAALLARLHGLGLPNVLDVGVAADTPYLVMDRIIGSSLAEVLSKKAMTPEQVIELAATVADALALVHHAGLIHRDIKPTNILVDHQGQPHLIDFGLASLMGKNAEKENFAGTIAYAAPEQSGGLRLAVDARSDLYSLGVVLFECIVGRLPFESDNAAELLRSHLSAVAPTLSLKAPGSSPALSAILERLLAKDPEDRYQSAEALAQDLRRIREIDQEMKSGREASLHYRDKIAAKGGGTLVGRSEELDTLRTGWSAARQKGRGCIQLIEGDPGAGKSRLAAELLKEARGNGAIVVSGKCDSDQVIPLFPFRAVLDDLAGQIETAVAAQHLRREDFIASFYEAAPLLGGLSRALAKALGYSSADAGESEPERFPGMIAASFAELSRSIPIVVFLDDVQWLDETSLEVTERIAGLAATIPLMMVVTARSDQGSAEGLARFKNRMGDLLSPTIALAALDEAAVRRLAEGFLSTTRIDDKALALLVNRSNGSPLVAIELLWAMLEEGILRPSLNGWLIEEEALHAIALPENVADLIMRRAASLSGDAATCLRIAAVRGRVFEPAIVGKASGLALASARAAMDEAAQARLTELLPDGRFAFVHDRVHEAFLQAVPPQDLRKIHQAIADAMTGSPPDQRDIYAYAHHLAHGEPAANAQIAIDANVAAGFEARRLFSTQEAFAFFLTAERICSQHGSELPALLVEGLAECSAGVGALTEAVEYFEILISRTDDVARKARLRSRISIAARNACATRKALDEAIQGLAELGKRPFQGGDSALLMRSIAFWVDSRMSRYFGRIEKSEEGKRLLELEIDLCDGVSDCAMFEMKPMINMASRFMALAAAERLPSSRSKALGYTMTGLLFGVLGMGKLAGKWSHMAREIADATGEQGIIARVALYNGFANHFAGNSLTAEKINRNYLGRLARYGTTGQWLDARLDLIWNLLMRGYWTQAAEMFLSARQSEPWSGAFQGHPHYVSAATSLIAAGYLSEGLDLADSIVEMSKRFPDDKYRERYRFDLLFTMAVFEARKVDVDAVENELRRTNVAPAFDSHHARKMYLHVAMYRLNVLRCCAAADRPAAFKALQVSFRVLKKASLVPVIRCQMLVVDAAMQHHQGKLKRAVALVDRAEALALSCGSAWGVVEATLERARILETRGMQHEAGMEARKAALLASDCGMRILDLALLDRLGAGKQIQPSDRRERGGSTSVNAESSRLKRQLDALLEVAMASTSAPSFHEQATNALDATIRVLGAERAFLFLRDGDSPLKFAMGRDAAGETGDLSRAYSTTVVRTVEQSRSACVVTGTEAGEISASESVVANDLRSIIAAPMTLRGDLVGVLYLDSRAARGIFGEGDAQLLAASASQIVVSLETAKAADVEIARTALEKDLAVTAAVQSLLLPASGTCSATHAAEAYYQPATQCGGDWWWAEARADGSLTAVVADVTGHGPGPAMITAVLASSMLLLGRATADGAAPEMRELLTEVGAHLHKICRGEYRIALTAVVMRADGKLTVWTAGGLPALVLAGNVVDTLGSPSSPLGDAATVVTSAEIAELPPGGRVLLATDGFTELVGRNGRMIGLKGAARMLKATSGVELASARDRIGENLAVEMGATQRDDDITFVILERRGKPV